MYDRIGRSYATVRQADPRLAAPIWDALGDVDVVLNVGGGTGSYEPPDCEVLTVEPSRVMISQRPAGVAPAIQAVAESLPFRDKTFDAAMAILTVQHWGDIEAGMAEMVRVARRLVVAVTIDPDVNADLWIIRDYLPEVAASNGFLPSMTRLLDALPAATVSSIPCPWDCSDRMFAALWARPEQYLDPQVRAATSVWHRLPQNVTRRALRQLRADLASGAWDARYGHLRTTPELDVGLRLIRAALA